MIFKKIKSDKGNSTFILGIMLIFVLLLVGGIMLDFSKAQSLKTAYIDAGRKATQAGIMEQDSRGYLKKSSVAKTLITYENLARPYSVKRDSYLSQCSNYGPSDVELLVTLSNSSGSEPFKFKIKRNQIPRVNADLDESGTARDALRAAEKSLANSIPPIDENDKFNKIQLNVTEGTENLVLPVGFKLTGGGDGMKCQKLDIAVKATTFTGDEDKTYD